MIITLTTDFGLVDPFVGVMKGVILGIASDAHLVDLTHEIPSYDVLDAAFILGSAVWHFPPGSVHLAVVDPGVGSRRRAIAVRAGGHYFVGPDNGIFSVILERQTAEEPCVVHQITNESLFRKPVSPTFHGRDVFAPVAAHIARGLPMESVGPRVLDFLIRDIPRPRPSGENRYRCRIIRVDKFGNLITNLRRTNLGRNFSVRIGGAEVVRLCASYADGQPGEVFAVVGSSGFIEISLNQDSAHGRLGVGSGAEFEVETDSSNH